MAKPWQEVESSAEYQALSPEKQRRAKEIWFDKVVVPKVDDPAQLDRYRNQFFASRSAPTESPKPSWFQTIDSAAGKAVANVLGFPGDIASSVGTYAANLIGKPEWGGPVLTSDQIAQAMGSIGADTDSYKTGTGAQQFGGRVAQELFETGLLAGPLARMMKTGITPVREAVGATGAGVGAASAQAIAPDNPVAELIGSIAGGVSGDLAVSGAKAAAGPVSQFIGGFFPRSKSQTRDAVGSALRERATQAPYVDENLRRAAELHSEYGFNPTLAQATGDPYFMTKTKATRAVDEVLNNQINESLRTQNQIISDVFKSIASEGDIHDTYRALREGFDTKMGRLDLLDARAASRREAALSDVARTQSPQQAGKKVRGNLREQEAQWKTERNRKFNIIPDVDDISSDDLNELSRQIIDEAQGDADIIPRVVTEISQKTDPVDTGLIDMNGMPVMTERPMEFSFDYLSQKRKQINREIKQLERGAGTVNPERLRNLYRMKNGIDETLLKWSESGNTEAMQRYRDALQYHAEGAAKFRHGETRSVLSTNFVGDMQVPDSAVLDQYISTGKGAVEKAQEFKRVFGDDPESISAMVDHLVAQVIDLSPNGKPNPKTVEKYLHSHRAVLNEFPEARSKINTFLRKGKVLDNLSDQTKVLRADAEKAAARLYLDTDPERLVSKIMSGNNPRQKLRELHNQVASNPDALAGLRRGFLDWMDKRITSKIPDLAGTDRIMPNQMRDFLKNNTDVMRQLYTPVELKALDDVLDMAVMTNRITGPAMPGGSDTATKLSQGAMSFNSVLSRLYGIERGVVGKGFVIREMGARFGHMLFRGMNENQAQSLLRDALVDPEIAKAMMAKVDSKNAKKTAEFLRVYLTGSVVGAVPEQTAEE